MAGKPSGRNKDRIIAAQDLRQLWVRAEPGVAPRFDAPPLRGRNRLGKSARVAALFDLDKGNKTRRANEWPGGNEIDLAPPARGSGGQECDSP